MKAATKQREKRCPACEKEYPEEDNYCGDDGSILEHITNGKHQSQSAGSPITSVGVNAKPNIVLQD